MSKNFAIGVIASSLASIFASHAMAQSASPAGSVAAGAAPADAAGSSVAPAEGYEPVGVRSGSFFIYPGLDVSVSTNDNIYGSPTKTSDTIFGVTPSVTIRSDWGRNALNVDGRLIGSYYSKRSTENTTAAVLSGNGRIDADRDWVLFGDARAADSYEPRSSAPQTAILTKPTEYNQYTANGGSTWTLNRFQVTAKIGADNFKYKNNSIQGGGVYSEAFRDHTAFTGSLRGEWTVSPLTYLFWQIEGNSQQYDHAPQPGDVSRKASGYTVLTGARYNLTHLLVGQIGIGYLDQSYKQAGSKSSSGLAMNTNLTWYATPLVALTGTASRQVNGSAIQGSPAYVTTSGGLAAAYEWRRNVSFNVQGSYATDDYNGISRKDTRKQAGAGADWKLNRLAGVYAQYNYLKQPSVGASAGRGFDDNTFMVGLRLRR